MLKMTKFEMKKNELLEKGKQEGYLLVSEVIEIAKECKASKAEVMAFQKEIKEEKKGRRKRRRDRTHGQQ